MGRESNFSATVILTICWFKKKVKLKEAYHKYLNMYLMNETFIIFLQSTYEANEKWRIRVLWNEIFQIVCSHIILTWKVAMGEKAVLLVKHVIKLVGGRTVQTRVFPGLSVLRFLSDCCPCVASPAALRLLRERPSLRGLWDELHLHLEIVP